MPNSGYVLYTNLEQYYLDNGVATGYIKPNNISDPDYVPTEYNTDVCPLPSATPSISTTPSITPTVTPTVTPTISVTPSITPSITSTPSVTPSITSTISVTPSITPTHTVSKTPSVTPSVTKTPSVTPSITPTISVTPTRTPSITPTPSVQVYEFLTSGIFGTSGVVHCDYGCSTYAPTTTYYVVGTLNMFTSLPEIGSRVYSSYPSTPVNGNNKCVGMKYNITFPIFPPSIGSVQIDTNGYVIDSIPCP